MNNVTKISAGVAAAIAGTNATAAIQAIELGAGWNLVSTNVEASPAQTVQSVFGASSNVERVLYRTADGVWKARDVQRNAGALSLIPTNEAFWVKVSDSLGDSATESFTIGSSDSMVSTLSVASSDTTVTSPGWKYIAVGQNDSVNDLIDQLSNGSLVLKKLIAWNRSANDYTGFYDRDVVAANTIDDTDINPGMGLWGYFTRVLPVETEEIDDSGNPYTTASIQSQLASEFTIKVYSDSETAVTVSDDESGGQTIENSTTINIQYTDSRTESVISQALVVPTIDSDSEYEIEVSDRFGNRIPLDQEGENTGYTRSFSTTEGATVLEIAGASAGCDVGDDGGCVTVAPTFFAYGLPRDSGATVLLQDVQIHAVEDESVNFGGLGVENFTNGLSTSPIAELRDPVAGVTIQELPLGAKIAFVKDGYLTVEKTVGESSSVYAIMQEQSLVSDTLTSSVVATEESGASRRLNAATAEYYPSRARNSAGAALLSGEGGENFVKDLQITVDPIRTEDAIPNFTSATVETDEQPVALGSDTSLEGAVRRYYESTGSSANANRNAGWSRNLAGFNFRVVGGARLTVKDANDGYRKLTVAERSASNIGPSANIRPYVSTTIDAPMEEYLRLSAEYASSSRADDYRVLIRPFVHTPEGWKLMSDSEVRFIDPDSDNETASSMETSSSKLVLDNVVWGYDEEERNTVRRALPRDQLIITTAGQPKDDNTNNPNGTGLLMSYIDAADLATLPTTDNDGTLDDEYHVSSSGGGLYDFAFVSIEVMPIVRDLEITVVDDQRTDAEGNPVALANSLITLNGGNTQLSDENGVVIFDNVSLPISSPSIEVSALRNDHYRNTATLNVGDITNHEGERYPATVRLREVGKTATVQGLVTDRGTGQGVDEADVSLISPAALSTLKADMDNEEFVAFKDPQALYIWKIRPHYDENQESRSEVLQNSAASGLHRVLVNAETPDLWQPIKREMGRSGGNRLTFDEVIRKLTNLEDDDVDNDGNELDYSLVGTYDVQVQVVYEIDQSHSFDDERFDENATLDGSGFGDYREVSGAGTLGTTISIAINDELFDDIRVVAGRPLHYPVHPDVLTESYQIENAVGVGSMALGGVSNDVQIRQSFTSKRAGTISTAEFYVDGYSATSEADTLTLTLLDQSGAELKSVTASGIKAGYDAWVSFALDQAIDAETSYTLQLSAVMADSEGAGFYKVKYSSASVDGDLYDGGTGSSAVVGQGEDFAEPDNAVDYLFRVNVDTAVEEDRDFTVTELYTALDSYYEVRGSREHGYFNVVPTGLAPETEEAKRAPVYWEVDITWTDTNGAYKRIEPVGPAENPTSFRWVDYDGVARHDRRSLLLTPEIGPKDWDPLVDGEGNYVDRDGNASDVPVYSWDRPILQWSHFVQKMSDPELFKAFLEEIPGAETNGTRYIDEVNNGGFSIKIKAVTYLDENGTDLNSNDTTADSMVPFVMPITAKFSAPFSQNRKSVLKVTDATAVKLEGVVERNTQTGRHGYYTFKNLPINLGAFLNDDLSSSFLRVGVDKVGYYGTELEAAPKFSRDIATTARLEDISVKDMQVEAIPKRDLTVTVTNDSASTIYLDGSDKSAEVAVDGTATFTDVYVGSYTVRVEPAGSNLGMGSQRIQLSPAVPLDGEATPGAQQLSITLPAKTWVSPLAPIIDQFEVSEILADGYVVVSGSVKEYRNNEDGTDTVSLVEYGVNDVQRVRDMVSIRVNSQVIPLNLADDNSSFAATIKLSEGLNGIAVSAVNEVGTTSTPLEAVNFFPSYGSVTGKIVFDHDADDRDNDGFNDEDGTEATAPVNAGGASLTVTMGDIKRKFVAEESGKFTLFGLPSGESININATIQTSIGRFEMLDGAETVTVPEGVQYNISHDGAVGSMGETNYDDPIVLVSNTEAADGAPEISVDFANVNSDGTLTTHSGGMLHFDLRLGNYDGQGVGSTSARPIQVSVNGEVFDIAPSADREGTSASDEYASTLNRMLFAGTEDETANKLWFVTNGSIRLNRRHNEIIYTATNLNGDTVIAPPLYVENTAIQLMNPIFTINAPDDEYLPDQIRTYGATGRLIIKHFNGEPVASRLLDDDNVDRTIIESLTGIEEGTYSYDISVPGYLHKHDLLLLDYEANDESLEQAVDVTLTPATLDVDWFSLDHLHATRIQAEVADETSPLTAGQLVAAAQQAGQEEVPSWLGDETADSTAQVYVNPVNSQRTLETTSDDNGETVDNVPLYNMVPAVDNFDNPIYTDQARVSGVIRLEIPQQSYTGSETFAALLQIANGEDRLPVQVSSNLPTASVESTLPGVDGTVTTGLINGSVSEGTDGYDVPVQYLIPFTKTITLYEGSNIIDAAISSYNGMVEEYVDTIDVTPGVIPGAMSIALDWATGSDMDLHSYYYPAWGVDTTTEDGSGDYTHITWWNRNYTENGTSHRVQNLDYVGRGREENPYFSPEIHEWATDRVNDVEVVADGTYLVVANDYSADDVGGITVTLSAPGIGEIQYGPYDSVNAGSGSYGTREGDGIQPIFVIKVENNRVIDVRPVPVGQDFGADVTDMIGSGSIHGGANGPDIRGMWRSNSLNKKIED